MTRLLLMFIASLMIGGCAAPTPIAEVDIPSLIEQADVLPSSFHAGTTQMHPPETLAAMPDPARVVSVEFTDNGSLVGQSTVLLYDTPEYAQEAYNTVAQTSEVANLGDQASIDTHTAVFAGAGQKVLDLVVLRCRTVTHLRFARTALMPDTMKEYARTIDKRVQRLGC